jgi:hypothetical protein
MGVWSCDDKPTKDSFECKTDKDGKFAPRANVVKAPIAFGVVKLTGKLLTPKGISVKGTMTFNGTKKKFDAKTGEAVDFGKFKVEKENTIELAGTTDPVTPNAALEFEVTHVHCPK